MTYPLWHNNPAQEHIVKKSSNWCPASFNTSTDREFILAKENDLPLCTSSCCREASSSLDNDLWLLWNTPVKELVFLISFRRMLSLPEVKFVICEARMIFKLQIVIPGNVRDYKEKRIVMHTVKAL